MKIVVKRARRGLARRNQWMTVVVGDNGEQEFSSERLHNKTHAETLAQKLRDEAATAEIVVEP